MNRELVQGLSLITSCGCNLKCEYCRIAQSVNNNSAKLQEGTIKALQDGTYIQNVKNVLLKLNQSPMNIESISFWGQEPTLTLHLVAEHLTEWFELFPNWRNTMFSTNTVAHMDRIVDFCVALDKAAPNPFDLSIQLSYDGDYSTDSLRGASSSIIHDNLIWLFTELNKCKFDKLYIRFNHHGVLSLDLLDKLQHTKNVIDYNRNLYKWGEEFYHLNSNSHVTLVPDVDIGLENPVEATPEQGMQLAYFCELNDRINPEEYEDIVVDHPLSPPASVQLYGGVNSTCDCIFRTLRDIFNIRTLDEAIDLMATDPIFRREFLTALNPNLYCGNGVGELKIMYDGTLINCQNHMYEADVQYLPKDNSVINSVKRSLATHNYFINPLDENLSDKTRDIYFDLFATCKFNSLDFIFETTVNTMLFLSRTNQIDVSYRDEHKLLKHALILSIQNACSYNNQIMTGSIFLRHSGFLRFMCNGYIDRALSEYNSMFGEVVI